MSQSTSDQNKTRLMCAKIKHIMAKLCGELADFQHEVTEPVMQRKFARVYKAIVEETEMDLLRIVEEGGAYVMQNDETSQNRTQEQMWNDAFLDMFAFRQDTQM